MKLGIVASSAKTAVSVKNPFMVQVDTTKSGLTPNNQVAVAFNNIDSSNSVLVDWGDGSNTVATDANTRYTKTYSIGGVYDVTVTPVGRFQFQEANTDKRKWISILDWGTNVFSSYSFLCNGATVLANTVAPSPPDFANADGSMANMFARVISNSFFQDIQFSEWETQNIGNMRYAFFYSSAALANTTIGDLDTSNVTDMSWVLANNIILTNNISWNTSKVSNLNSAFWYIKSQNTDAVESIATWDVSNVVDFGNCFYGDNFSGAANWAPNISEWNTVKAANMANMFRGQLKQTSSIVNWNVANVTNMYQMFAISSVANQPIGNWNVGNVSNMSTMFGSATTFNQDIGNWNVANVTDMSQMFKTARAFVQDISSWNVGNVANMSQMFSGANAFNQPIGNWNVSKVANMNSMWFQATNFNQPIGNWNISNVSNMRSMFSEAQFFNQDIGNWKTGNVTDMIAVFNGATVFNQDISQWCVTNIPTAPTNFSTGSALTAGNLPVWGTCPNP